MRLVRHLKVHDEAREEGAEGWVGASEELGGTSCAELEGDAQGGVNEGIFEQGAVVTDYAGEGEDGDAKDCRTDVSRRLEGVE